jgi:hypothetical protein
MHGIFRMWWGILQEEMGMLILEGLVRDRQVVVQAVQVGFALPSGAAGRRQGTRLLYMLRSVSSRIFCHLLVN